ncbi:MAG: serine hydrolase domain-containing protein [Cellvibrionaceae bacterium]
MTLTTKCNTLTSTLRTLATGLATGLASSWAFSITPPNEASAQLNASDWSSELNQNIEQLLDQHQLPGLVLSIKHQGELIHFDAYGKVNVDDPKPMDKNALFRIYSMSKPITALALLQLVEKGQVSLEEDIRTYLPAFEPFEIDGNPQVVTVHQLLSHTAGFGYGGGIRSWVDIRYLIANPLSRNNTLDDLIDDLSGIDLKFSPGQEFGYSIASDIQGAIIEKVSGLRLDVYLERHIFKPLKMNDTHFSVPKGQQHRLVDAYVYDAQTFENALTFNKDKIEFGEHGSDSEYLERPTLLSGGGGLVSTAKDYAQFVSLLHNKGMFEGQRLLSEALVNKMLSSHTQGMDTHFLPRIYNGVGFGYGLGIKETTGDLRNQGSFFWAGLGGTVFWADPKANLEVVAMMQVEDGWIVIFPR